MQLVIELEVLIVLEDEGFENLHGQLSESVITIVLAYRKVDIVSSDAIVKDVEEGVKELKSILINIPTLIWLVLKLFGELKVLD